MRLFLSLLRGSASPVALASIALVGALLAPASARADEASIRARLAALHPSESEPRGGEADLIASAERALDRLAADRAEGDEAGADRAERIADLAVTLVETRRRRAEAEAALAAARARRAEVAARGTAADRARESDERERERLTPPAEPAP